MRNAFVVTTVIVVLACPVALPAQDAPLGKLDVAVQFGYVVFSAGAVEDDGIYLGLAGYGRVAANVYLGVEAASSANMTVGTDEMSLTPLEVNVKYARAIGSGLVLAGSAGVSYARAEFLDHRIPGPDVKYDEWLFGGQLGADLLFRAARLALGVNAKYQLVQDFEQVAADFSNLRIGLQAGVVF